MRKDWREPKGPLYKGPLYLLVRYKSKADPSSA
jgi:hypothetical protein